CLKMPIVLWVVRQELQHTSLTKDGHKYTYTSPPLPEFYLQITCKLAAKSPAYRSLLPGGCRSPPRTCASTARGCVRNAARPCATPPEHKRQEKRALLLPQSLPHSLSWG